MRERLRRFSARFLSRSVFGGADSQIAKRIDAALRNDPIGDFMDGCEDTTDATVGGFVGDRTVRNGEVRFFHESTTIDFERDVLRRRFRPFRLQLRLFRHRCPLWQPRRRSRLLRFRSRLLRSQSQSLRCRSRPAPLKSKQLSPQRRVR